MAHTQHSSRWIVQDRAVVIPLPYCSRSRLSDAPISGPGQAQRVSSQIFTFGCKVRMTLQVLSWQLLQQNCRNEMPSLIKHAS